MDIPKQIVQTVSAQSEILQLRADKNIVDLKLIILKVLSDSYHIVW